MSKRVGGDDAPIIAGRQLWLGMVNTVAVGRMLCSIDARNGSSRRHALVLTRGPSCGVQVGLRPFWTGGSQVLEHGLANALLVFDLVPEAGQVATPITWPNQIDAFYAAHFKRTLGSLIRRLREVAAVPPHLEALLEAALNKRNWLSHHYFREKAADFLTISGRDRMISELEEAHDLLSAADKALDAVVKPVQKRYGYTEEMFAKVVEDMRREAGGKI